jgi:hypothetical protein
MTRRVALLLVAALAAGACGKKGAPIPPPLRIPAPVQTISAVRLGSEVYVTLTVPATNIDMSIPVDIGRIEVYGYTGRVVPRARWAELGTLLATIDIPPVPLDYRAPTPATAALLAPSAMPGTPITVRDTLTPDEFEQGPVYVDPRRPELATPTIPGVAVPNVMRRFYVAIPFSRRGRPSTPGALAEFVLTALPEAPADLRATQMGAMLSLTWLPSGGVLGFLLDRGLPPEPPPFVPTPQPVAPVAAPLAAVPDTGVPPGPTTYQVYRDLAPDPLELPLRTKTPGGTTLVPQPLNTAPLGATETTDQVAFDRAQCYVVRAQRGTVLSEPSPRACVTAVDIEPPAPPTGLAAVPSEGGINLIWEPNGELDLGGYLVLRREPGDATLRQLTETPIPQARYRDADVRPGARYIYSVVAVDTRLPLPNVSAQSAVVEDTAR